MIENNLIDLKYLAKRYLQARLREQLANERGLNPSDIDYSKAEALYENDNHPKYSISQTVVKSVENGRETVSVVVALVDRETGIHYDSEVFS